MRTHEQVKWDFVQQWLDKARKDLAAGEVLLKGAIEDYENVGFHAQQAAEKFIFHLRTSSPAVAPGY
jgi:HEPN domain-containing protein